jgi:copper resistance protein B
MPGMDMSETPETHAGHDMAAMPDMSASKSGTDLPPGAAAPPAVQPGRPADNYYDPAAMARAESALLGSHGGMIFHRLLIDLAEYQVRDGRDGYRWDGEFWVGGDTNRLVLKSEGEGSVKDRVESAEVQALYAHALDPYWNLQIGIRQDLEPKPTRTYAVLGIEGLAPYWGGIDGALFLSDKGDVLGRVTASYDQRITRKLILQPRGELNFSLQDVPRQWTGSGVSDLELGLRLRYEIKREFAPYLGISWERRLGETADFARAVGESTGGLSVVTGVRTWF